MDEVPLNETFVFDFTTRAFASGIPTTVVGGALRVKEEGNETVIAAGVTLDPDTATPAVAGMHEASIAVTTGNGYTIGKYYSVFVSAGTVDGTSMVGEVLKTFRVVPSEVVGPGIKPVSTVALGNDGVAGANLAADYDGTGYDKANSNIGSVGTVGLLSGHTPQTGDNYPRVADIQNRLPAALSGGRMASDAQALSSDTGAADNLRQGANQLYPFTVGASPSATSIPTDIVGAPYTNTDHFKNRVVTINQETKPILGSSGSPVVLTVADFASVPSQNDAGVIS